MTVIELGNGQVMIEAGLHQDGHRACVTLAPISTRDPEALLVFSTPESIDAMMRVLSVARDGLIARSQ